MSSARPCVLFVDDEIRIVSLLSIAFRCDYAVLAASSAEEALQLCAAHTVHVIVSDQRMPGMTGVELLSQVRRRYPATMRLLLTGYSDLEAIVGSINEAEVHGFIQKPWKSFGELRVKIADAVATSLHVLANPAPLDAASDAPESAGVAGEQLVPASAAAQPKVGAEILVLLDSEQANRDVKAVPDGLFEVHVAATWADGIGLILSRSIGVVIASTCIDGNDGADYLALLKAKRPEILSIVVDASGDSDIMTRYINYARICRYVSIPVGRAALLQAVAATEQQHRQFLLQPSTLAQQRAFSPLAAFTDKAKHFLARAFARLGVSSS